MSQSSMRDERLILINPAHSPLLRKVTRWDRLVATFTDPDLVAVIPVLRAGSFTNGCVDPSPSRLGRVIATALVHSDGRCRAGMLPKVTPVWWDHDVQGWSIGAAHIDPT